MTNQEEMYKLFKELNNIAICELERIARKIMNRYKSIDTFCCAMGTWSFYDESGPLYVDDPRFKEMSEFMMEWNDNLYLTGYPLRIDRKGNELVATNDW